MCCGLRHRYHLRARFRLPVNQWRCQMPLPAKDDLIVAWVTRSEERSATNLPPVDGPVPLVAYADHMVDIAGKTWCMGCTYQGTAAEFSDPAHPAHAAALGVKQRVIENLHLRATNQGLPDPQACAERVFLFLEGVWAATRMFGATAPLTHAKDAIRKLIA
jgi:hypothetical protein